MQEFEQEVLTVSPCSNHTNFSKSTLANWESVTNNIMMLNNNINSKGPYSNPGRV